jgi:hypothetical protein
MKAWHFLDESGLLCDGTKPKRKNAWLRMRGEPVMCERGYHASKRLIDALTYAPGPILCRVELGGSIIESADKCVATERRILWRADISELLHRFACDESARCLRDQRKEGAEIDPRCDEAIRIKRLWLRGKAADDDLTLAYSAARSAANSAVWSAVWSAANSRLTRRVNNLMRGTA